MNIYVYSDESGVFDNVHNDVFVFGGIVFLGKKSKEEWARRYSAAEKTIRKSRGYNISYELKATKLLNSDKNKLYRSLNNCYKFGVVINQKEVLENIFNSKKDKQRYLDYAYKIAVKRFFEKLLKESTIHKDDVENIYFYVDEHTTATNGCYELKEALEQEFKNGTYNYNYGTFYPPIFPKLKSVNLIYCNSESNLLIRASDIVANKIYYMENSKKYKLDNMINLIRLPR